MNDPHFYISLQESDAFRGLIEESAMANGSLAVQLPQPSESPTAKTALRPETKTSVPQSRAWRTTSSTGIAPAGADDLWWLSALQRGDERGLKWLVQQYGRWIYSKAFRILGSHEDAEEAWQDIFMRVWQKIHLWDPERGNFQSWLNQIAKNAIIDMFRKKNRHREVLQHGEEDGMEELLLRHQDTAPLPDEQLASKELYTLVLQSLSQMSKVNHRNAWILRHLEGLSIAEIGALLHQKENTVKVWIFRATKELRSILIRRGLDFDPGGPEEMDEDS